VHEQPARTLGLITGTVLTLWALGTTVVLLNFGLDSAIGVPGLLAYSGATAAAALALLFAYWTYALSTLAYTVDRNGLVIHWGATRQVVPLGEIERLIPGTSVGVPRVRGVSWWGHHVGSATIDRIGPVLFYSTHQSPEQVLYVMTSERAYALSVGDPAAFAQEIQTRQELGPTAEVPHRAERSGAAALSALAGDRTALVLTAAAILGLFAVWLQIALRFPDLNPTIPLHFPPHEADPLLPRLPRSALLELPRIASAVLAVNLVVGLVLYSWERVAGYLMWAGAAAIQAACFVAIVTALD
jgi:hypothetical protein